MNNTTDRKSTHQTSNNRSFHMLLTQAGFSQSQILCLLQYKSSHLRNTSDKPPGENAIIYHRILKSIFFTSLGVQVFYLLFIYQKRGYTGLIDASTAIRSSIQLFT